MKKLLLTQILFFLFLLNLQSQLLINQAWVSSSGEPDQFTLPGSQWDNIDYNSSTLMDNGDLIVVGNTKQSIGNTDILVTKYGINGQVLWEQTYAGSAGSYDYGLAVTIGNNGNVIVAGVITNNNATTDIIILKYATDGTLLVSTLIGDGNNQFDIPTAITTDGQDNIFVIGSNMNTPTDSKWIISKLNSNGILQWSNSYNYSNFHEIPSSIKFSGNDLSVMGFSSSSSSEWDFANVIFSGSNGNILIGERKQIANLSTNDPISIKSDNSNNIFIGGSTDGIITGNQDIQVVKINSDFDIEWIRTVDEEELDDKAKVLDIDNLGNIIIAGNSTNTNNQSYITFSKFDSDGNTLFHKGYSGPASVQNAEAETMKISNNNDILISGFVEKNDYKSFVTIILDSNGNINSEKFYNSNVNTNDIAKSIEILNDSEFFIVGKSEGDESKYTTIKYETIQRPEEVIIYNDKPLYRAHEFLVKFAPQYVDSSFVNDSGKQYGTIEDILNANGVSNLSRDLIFDDIRFAKAFPRLTTLHTTSLSRLGELVPIPEFWSTFVVMLPQDQSLENNIDLFQNMETLVDYAQHNQVFHLTSIPNDEFFNADNQQSLYASSNSNFQNANINIEPAWELETGQNYTKVGVYDTPVQWSHEDFGDGTLAGSQVKGGFDYVSGVEFGMFFGIGAENRHGTSVAGIIGALRNNEKGIAGIAGGGIDGQNINNPGVQLYSQVVSNTQGGFTADIINQSIVEGVMDVVNPVPGGMTGLGLHITNHSYGITEDPLVPTDFLFYATIDAMKFSFRNHVLSVVSKGNSGTDGSAFPSVPADVRNEWVLCVGASGTDGEYKNFTNGDNFGFGPDCTPWASSYGGGIDIIAPGVTDIISTLINQVPTGDDFNCGYPAPLSVGVGANYQVFSGTSASAPHAAGVAALMHGLHNTEKGQYNNLAPEDYEYLFKEYRTDISGGLNNYPVGPDPFNGHGRINAGAILEKLEAPNWSVWHNFDPASEDITIEESTSTINSVEVTQYKITHTYHYVFSPSTQILDAWKRNSSVIGTLPPNGNNNYEAEFDFTINGNIADVTATTYFYKEEYINGQVSYFPTENIEDAKTRFSLHLYNPNGITSVKEITADNKNIKIFPNPTDGVFSLKHNLKGKFSSILNIFDTTGRVIFSDKVFLEENQSLKIDLQQFPNGIYFCQLKTDSGIYSSKVIKQ